MHSLFRFISLGLFFVKVLQALPPTEFMLAHQVIFHVVNPHPCLTRLNWALNLTIIVLFSLLLLSYGVILLAEPA